MSRVVGRSGVGGQGGCNDVGLICQTPVGIGLTDLSVKGRSPPCPPGSYGDDEKRDDMTAGVLNF